jgi:nitrite reductase (NADH) small subunit
LLLFGPLLTVLLRFMHMQSFSTDPDNLGNPPRAGQTITFGSPAGLTLGRCVRLQLPDGGELALFNVDGEYHATENFCPHKGAPLTEGTLSGHVIECQWHGWQFDVRSGECLTAGAQLKVYPVIIDDGLIKIEI